MRTIDADAFLEWLGTQNFLLVKQSVIDHILAQLLESP